MVLPRGWWLDDRRIPVPTLFAATATPPAEKTPRRRTPRPAAAEPVVETELPLTNGDAPPSWTPEFDPGDDLNGLLDAKTRLLSRAFRSGAYSSRAMGAHPRRDFALHRGDAFDALGDVVDAVLDALDQLIPIGRGGLGQRVIELR